MTSPLKVRGLGSKMHETWEYAVADIYLPDTKNGKEVISVLRREIHLIENLKANMLLGNDVIDSEKIVLDVTKKSAVIGSTDATIALKPRSARNAISKLVHLRKSVVVPARTEMTVDVHNACLPKSRDFLFESSDDVTELAMYAHLVDVSTSSILVRNDKNYSVKIPRNARLGKITEIDFPNAFQVEADEDVRSLATKQSKATHRDGWFRKLISACAVAYAAAAAVPSEASVLQKPSTPVIETEKPSAAAASPAASSIPAIDGAGKPFAAGLSSPPEVILSNDVTIHKSKATDSFAKIVEEFPSLWNDIGFAKMSEKN